MSQISGLVVVLLAWTAGAANIKSPTPPMGWNSYNAYGCNPTEQRIKTNAQGLINTGLKDLGYTIVTPDCGWQARNRDSQQRMQWNTTLFPSGGGKSLANYIHGLGLKFGLYSGAGYHQCGSTDLPGSLGELIEGRRGVGSEIGLSEAQALKKSMQNHLQSGRETH